MTALPVSADYSERDPMPSRHLAHHLAWCVQRNLRPVYIETRRRTINQLARELGMRVEDATENDYLAWYQDVTLRMVPEASAVYLSHVQCYARWLLLNGFLEKDPTIRLVRPRVKPGVPRPPTDADVIRAVRTASARVRPWLLLQLLGGLRACEVAVLRVRDVDPQAGKLLVNGKGGKQRLVPIHPLVREVLQPFLTGRGFLFSHWSKPGPPTAHNVSHAVNRHLRQQGILDTAHSCRHWYITNVYRLSKDLRLTQELAGHSSPNQTARYAAWAEELGAGFVNQLEVG